MLARDGDMLTLKWRDYPWQPNVHAARRVGGAVEANAGQHLTGGITARAVSCGPSTFPPPNLLIEANHEPHHRTHSRAQ